MLLASHNQTHERVQTHPGEPEQIPNAAKLHKPLNNGQVHLSKIFLKPVYTIDT